MTVESAIVGSPAKSEGVPGEVAAAESVPRRVEVNEVLVERTGVLVVTEGSS